MVTAEPRAQVCRLVVVGDFANCFEVHLLDEEMRLYERDTPNPMILKASRVNCGNRSTVAMTEKNSALEAYLVKHLG